MVVVSSTVRSVISAKPGVGALRRGAATSLLGALLLAVGACSVGAAGNGGQAGSCASEITITGVTYIAGRGSEGAAPVPHNGTELHGTTSPCNDTPGSGSTVPAQPAIAYAIPGVLVADAVAGPGSNEVMVAERLWQRPWTELPPELQPYVRR